jgi:type IV secretory pathway TraG/TraD family ATPase VirD4
MRANLASNGPELYVGTDGHRLVWAGPQQALLALGPPRSGKTSALVVPNVLAAPGPVLVTSTKPDVLRATLASRAGLGRCWLLDPTGTVAPPPGAHLVRWSPVQASSSWEEALVTARVMTTAARPHGYHGDSAHWTERAEALLAPMLHAAALASAGMRQVLTWALRHDLYTPMALLGAAGSDAGVAADVLAGILATEERERSGILSTAAGALSAYRSSRALDLAERPNFDPSRFPEGGDTMYVCAPARYQALVAPVVVAFLEQVRAATYRATSSGTLQLPVTLVLDEVANIAPLPDLPAMVSEGGGQGLLIMACLQDLSQARGRWGQAADGFFSLFGTKVLLPGIGDMRTLEAVSKLAGQVDVPVRSVNRSAWWSGRPSASTTYSWRRQPRLPVDKAHGLPAGSALVLAGARPPRLAWLTAWWAHRPFADARAARLPAGRELPEGATVAAPPAVPLPPSPLPGRTTAPADLAVKWHNVAGQRPLHPPPPRS